MTHSVQRTKQSAVRILSFFLCAFLLLFSIPATVGQATSEPLLYVNDTVFVNWEKTPPHTVDGIVYIPVTMFIDLEAVYYYSNPKVGTFYLQNETTNEYLSFSLKTSDAYDGKSMLNIKILVFHDTIYLPAIETSNRLGLYLEMNPDHTVVRLSDSTAKMPFSKLISLYNPVISVPNTPSVKDENPDVTDEPIVTPCDLYLCFTDPSVKNLDQLIVALNTRNLPATFFLSPEYIQSNPREVLKIFSNGYSMGLYPSGNYRDYTQLMSELNHTNELLRKIIKQKTRIVALTADNTKYSHRFQQNGYIAHTFNITLPQNPTSSKSVTTAVTSVLTGVSQAKILVQSDIYSITALYDIGKFINSHSVIKTYIIDETV